MVDAVTLALIKKYSQGAATADIAQALGDDITESDIDTILNNAGSDAPNEDDE